VRRTTLCLPLRLLTLLSFFCTSIFSTYFRKFSNIEFHENHSSVSRVVPCGQTDGRTDMTKLVVAFRKVWTRLKRFRMEFLIFKALSNYSTRKCHGFYQIYKPHSLLRNPVHDIKYSFLTPSCMNVFEVISALLVNFVNGVLYYQYINLRTK